MFPPTDEMLEIRNIFYFNIQRLDKEPPVVANVLFQGNFSWFVPPSLEKLETAVGSSTRFSINENVFVSTFRTLVVAEVRKLTSTCEIERTY